MTDEPKGDPAKRMRKLLGNSSPMERLPKKDSNEISSFPKPRESEKANAFPEPSFSARDPQRISPASTQKRKPALDSKSRIPNFGALLWNAASIISLTVNVFLMIVLIVLAIGLNRFGLSVSSMLGLGTELLGGLYGNFEKMDRAHITTNIEVSTTIPVKFDLLLNQQTNVVLSQDVTINNALVTVNTGGLNITRANTTIVLPQGTTLPVVLNLTVPVDTTVPVTLNVPVDIPMDKTQLHEPFTGLQEVLKPIYCLIKSNAVNLNGEPICK
ncbi:MAG: hypothetical protein Q7J80_11710 [Anaerolineales bacterium]|nr:hypothetical protein [Anaerolineales bacterium]